MTQLSHPPRLLLIGSLTRDFIFYPDEPARLDLPGGRALAAAAGAVIWEKALEIVAEIGQDYPSAHKDLLHKHGLSLNGLRVLDQPLEQRAVYSYDAEVRPGFPLVQACLRHGIPFPSALLGYQAEKDASLSLQGFSPFPLPPSFQMAAAAYLCAMPPENLREWIAYLYTHGVRRLVATFPKLQSTSPAHAQKLPLLEGLEALLIHENDLRILFWGKSDDLWEMAAQLSSIVPHIVIHLPSRRCLLYSAPSNERWEIPAYPARGYPIGVEEAFGGGFLAGLLQTSSLLQAVLHGAISAAFKSESLDPFYCWDVLPELARSRLEYLALLAHPL
ncbi:MAG: hypothetical protein WHS87_06270 [Anaerolineales bacterium]